MKRASSIASSIAGLALFTGPFVVPVLAQESTPQQDNTTYTLITFEQPVSVIQVINRFKAVGARPAEVVAKYDGNGESFTSGLVLPASEQPSAEAVQNSMRETFPILSEFLERRPILKKLFNFFIQLINTEDIKVSEVVVSGVTRATAEQTALEAGAGRVTSATVNSPYAVDANQ